MAKYKRRRRASRAFTLFVVVALIAVIVFGVFLWKNGYLDGWISTGGSESVSTSDDHSSGGGSSSENGSSSGDASAGDDFATGAVPVADIVSADLSIHFLELGNKYTGDCTLIKSGDTEILIDAGSRQNSAATINGYLEDYCTDGVLEYVIATHAHQDHIAGFVGNKSGGAYNGVLYTYEVGTLIQFDRTNQSPTTESGGESLYGKYVAATKYAEERGTNVYTALQCWNNADGAQRSYEISEGITMNFLYQRYYEEDSSDENNYSVCMLLTQGETDYLFTGDLEKEGEASLVENNILPHCKLYKGGHHGSPTSSTEALMAAVSPEIVCVCCCCGSDEYTSNVANMFPSQAFVDRVAPYTDKIYVTTIVSDDDAGFASMNGNIVLFSVGGNLTVSCSASTAIFRDSDWFKANRTWPQTASGG